jgi:hypothetical protein
MRKKKTELPGAPAVNLQRLVSCEQARAAILAEPELPGDMPDEMWEAMRNDRQAAVECMRIVVRQTKVGIIRRLNL